VLAGDPLTCDDRMLEHMEVDLTMVGGRVVFERAARALQGNRPT
jgi:predicted amidohydrolase YtcJ